VTGNSIKTNINASHDYNNKIIRIIIVMSNKCFFRFTRFNKEFVQQLTRFTLDWVQQQQKQMCVYTWVHLQNKTKCYGLISIPFQIYLKLRGW